MLRTNDWHGRIFALVTLLLLAMQTMPAFAIDVYDFENEAEREKYQQLGETLRCPKCQNQNIADSDAPIASDMRAAVYRLIKEGKSVEEIRNHMIDRFGEFVVYRPQLRTKTLLLWYGPWVFALLGLAGILYLVAKSVKNAPPAHLTEQQQKAIHQLLKEDANEEGSGGVPASPLMQTSEHKDSKHGD